MTIIIDKDIPFIQGVFEPYAHVVYAGGGEINREMVKEADALIIRTRTKCNANLLSGSQVKLIASATIGKDHVDTAWCEKEGIRFINAAGCNAGGVMQYVYTALFGLAHKKGIRLRYNTNPLACEPVENRSVLGVIGVGNVGSKVAQLGEYLGFEVLRNDPQKEREQTLAFNQGYITLTDFKSYYSLDYLLEHADIITMHVPLDNATLQMANPVFFFKMKAGSVFINTSRGEVVNEDALLRFSSKLSGLILDVWNHEPEMNRELLAQSDIATPHIAGYSYEGKVNGTTMVVKGVAEFFNIKELADFSVPDPDTDADRRTLQLAGMSQDKIWQSLNNIFPIFDMDKLLRENPEKFEQIRSNYKYRREFYVNCKR